MRLTLRYLLAYLDDQLDPADAKALSQRIEASQFATDLMHRVRDVSRRLKLGAPKLKARGLAGDPNTVAEYLDHTMPPDQVAEFEKICLTSDVHLAEVASAHQILALVLGERAEVDPQLRRRMYALPLQTDATGDQDDYEAALGDTAHQSESAATETSLPSGRRRPEIPEWLREQPKRQNRRLQLGIVGGVLVAVAVGVGGYVLFGISGTEPVVASHEAGPAVNSPDSDRAAAVRELPPAKQEPATERDAAAIETTEEKAAHRALEAGTQDETARPPGDEERELAATPAGGRPETAPVVMPPRSPRAEDSAFDTEVPPATDDSREAAASGIPAADEPPTALGDQSLVPPDERPPTGDGADSQATIAVGRLINDSDILVHATGSDEGWRRLSTQDALLADQELIALPTFRPGIALSTGGGAMAHLVGGSVVRLLPPDQNGVPGLHIVDGQVVIATAGKPGTQLNLRIGDELYLVTFLGPDARVAVDAHRWLADGVDPLDDQVRTTADLYVASGAIEYSSASQAAPTTVKAPAARPLIVPGSDGETPASTESTFPPWIHGNPLSQVEKWAAEALDKELIRDEPVLARLRDLADHRKVEVRNLAVHCLTLLGDFEAFLPLLNDDKQKVNWPSQIEAVRRVLARNPVLAQQIKETLDGQRDAKKAKDIYEMLRGYSKRQLQDGAAARLVAYLDHEDLDIRVLAFWNLQRVSVGTLGYRPEYTAAKRQQGVRAWKQKLADGQVVPKSSG